MYFAILKERKFEKIGGKTMDEMFYLLIAGTRTYTDYQEFSVMTDWILRDVKMPIAIVSGGAAGADAMAERYAKERGYGLYVFPAYWDKFGKSAGAIRNQAMHDFIAPHPHRACLLFWDMISKGTRQSVDLAKERRTPLYVYDIDFHYFRKDRFYDVTAVQNDGMEEEEAWG